MSKQFSQLQGKEELDDVIIHLVKAAAEYGIEGKLTEFARAVDYIRDLLDGYWDEDAKKNFSKEQEDKHIKFLVGPDKLRRAQYRFRQIAKLLGRAGFAKAARTELVINAETEDIIKEISKSSD